MTNLRDRFGRCARRAVVVSILALVASSGRAMAQEKPAPGAGAQAAGEQQTPTQLLNDYLHYVKIDRYDLAQAMAQELLNRKLPPQEFVSLVEAGDVSNFTSTNYRAMREPRLEPLAAVLLKTYETGKLSRARDAEEIERNIQALTSTIRGRLIARERLLAAGEYAMPQLLNHLLDRNNPTLAGEVRRVMIDLGRQAVMPLVTAVPSLPATNQETVVDTLGVIPWRSSLPFLVDLRTRTKNDRVREACARAIERLGGTGGADPAVLYRSLAEDYYNEKSEVTSFWGEDFQLLWSYDPGLGLVMTAIRTPVYHEAMAMRLSERAMQIETGTGAVSPATLSLWIAANYSREIDTPQGYENPAYPASRRSAEYYAVAAGSDVTQLVLGRAIDDRDTPLARRALSAVEQTAGGRAVSSAQGRSPLLEALTYPNRRVQYEAALALANSQPQQTFSGADRVVPTLAGAIRGGAAQYAAVVSPDAEMYQSARKMLQGLGYTVLPQGRTLGDLAAPVAEAPAVDLVVTVGLGMNRVPGVVDEVRGNSKLAATPVLVMAPSDAAIDLRRRYEGDARVAVRPAAAGEQMLSQAVRDLVEVASGGPISESEGASYSSRSLAALRDLAVSNNQVLNVSDASMALIGALTDTTGQTRMRVAEILSRIAEPRAQRALADAALAAGAQERIDLLGLVAGSAKRYGNQLEARQVGRVVQLAGDADDAQATAAAALMGALQVSNTQIVPLILKGQ